LADDVGNQVKLPGEICYNQLVELLGRDILDEEGYIDRNKMASAIFSDKEILLAVNAIIHPAVKEYILTEIQREKEILRYDFFFVEAALLIECGYGEYVDELWYIYASEDIRRERLKASRGYSDEKVSQIMNGQLKEDEFRNHCQVIIDNGKDFDMSDFMDQQEDGDSSDTSKSMPNNMPGGHGNSRAMTPPGGVTSEESGTTDGDKNFPNNMMGGFEKFDFSIDEETVRNVFEELGLDDSVLDGLDFDNLTLEDIQEALSNFEDETMQSIMEALRGSGNMEMPDMGGFGGMGSSDVKLQYIDDDPESYANIFDSAKTNVTETDQNRLIESLKQLSEYENIDEVVNVEDVLKYFVIHNFVVNGDSYTGSMIHNYYLYEENGQMSMLPWDYNLAFGTFQGGSASSSVNDDIDEALSDRPMQAWIFSDDSYSQQYYELYAQMLEQIDIQGIIDNAYALISPYVEKDPTAFCTVDEFRSGVETLKEFCTLRAESVSLQLSGSSDTVDTGDLNLSEMGTMGNGMGGFGGRGGFGKSDFSDKENSDSSNSNTIKKNDTAGITQLSQSSKSNASGVMKLSQDMQRPEGMEMPEGMQPPEGMELPDGAESVKDENSSDNNSQESETEEAENNSNDNVKEKEDNSDDFQSNGIPDFGNRGEWGGMTPDGESSTSTVTNMVLFAVSVLFLGIGLFVAFKFKR